MRLLGAPAEAIGRLPAIAWALGALTIFGWAFVPGFGSFPNLMNVLQQSSALAVLALGQAFVIAGGMIDLSVGQLVGLIAVIAAMLFDAYPHFGFPIVLFCLIVAGAIGVANGELINRLRLPPLILTFGMLSVLQGCIFLLTDRSVGSVIPSIHFLANGRVLGVPVSLVVVAAIAAIAYFVLKRSIWGWHLLSIGHDAGSARKAGIDLAALTRLAYLGSGLCAGIAALIVAGRLGTGFPNAGTGLELDAIVAVVLGGTPLKGGRVSILGILCAVLFLGVLGNILNLLQVPAFTQMLVKGGIVIVAILLDRPARVRAPA